ncbi:hypothetical protein L3Q82_011429 [Scortum barcoo]|uniref:Uncharacterized protein n=1 Tax=Scortum barcoo TaxID=214431 RepID=A0ACB8WAC2_9TELE|nr:hypothetical protein L3Q82_011429 [Scortum barcoo]
MYCEGLLGTSGRKPSVREVFNSHLRKSFSQIPREAGDIESEWTMFSASIVDAVQFEVVDARSLVPVVVAIPEPGGGHRKHTNCRPSKLAAARTVLEAKTRVWEEFGEAAMEEDYRSAFEEILANRPAPQKGEAVLCQHCLQCGWGAVDLDWGHCRTVEEILRGSPQSHLTCLPCLWSGKLGWWSLLPLFKKGDRRVCSNYRGITLLSLPGKVSRQGTGEENSADSRTLGFRRNNAVFVLVVEQWTSSIPSTGCWRVYGSLPNQSTCALWIWRRHSTVSLVVFCGECSVSMGSGAFAKGCSVSVRPEQELGSHCLAKRSQGPEGVRFGNHRISSLLFADDVVLLASSSQDLQHVLERFAAECEAAGMRISTSKSEAMVLDRKRVACPLQVSGEVLPQVEEFKYLGVLFTSEGKIEREIDRRIGAASHAVMRTVVVKKELSREKGSRFTGQSTFHPHLWS